ncbi:MULTISPECIES: peptide ABC transporter substrate-binding protein [Metabacillus]|uniref:Peptide ABC transporter substrate-binding protein n=1 Tax=Metabacillus indicus TaxID=246786 RepID=A0A084H1K3_METID|nr:MULTISPECIES: peptide ABC transporter substrate-binding protein [Metabacillus]KEZ52269.1 peptide ABC transporter substrate-binding protein [Metabacillus indicus LMG 22858]KEZ53465.1 peptide ABC transporter substrate-binding protein [Metabacillus indicus]
MKKSKFSLLLVLSLVLSVFLTACYGGGGSSSSDGGDKDKDSKEAANVPQELKVLESSEIPSMDSVLAEDTISLSQLNNTNEGLYRIDENQEPIPGMADGEPEANEDGTEYTIKIKEDAKWSNGEPVTANDFVFAWQRALNPDTGSAYGPYMMMGKIKNAEALYNGKAKPEDLGVKAQDEKTLVVTLEKPIPFFKSLMAFPTFYPQNQKYVEEQGENFGKKSENLVFNGPFAINGWEGPADTEWTLEKNAEYWDAKNVSLEKITFNVSKDPQAAANAFEAGEADVTPKLSTPAVIAQYEGDDRLERWLEPTIFWLKLNQKNEALANVNIRKAIAMAFNKEDLTNEILNNGSKPANYAVPAEFVTHPETGEDFREVNKDLLTYNPEEAKKLWEKGLAEIGKKEVKLVYLGGDTETSKTVDSYMKDQLQNTLPGLTIDVQSVPFSVRLDRDKTMDYDIQAAGWGPDYLDPISFSDLWITDGGNNRMAYSNEKYDKLLKDAQTTLANDPAKRFAALQEAEKVLLEEDAGIAPMYQRASNLLINKKVEGFTYHLVGPEYSYKWIKITDAE